jgi:cytochrome P450
MAQFPEIQSRLRAEFSSVTEDRMPTLLDTEKMPYLDAATKEVMRLYPAAPVSLPHATIEDDLHDGYSIPKDSMVFYSLWCVQLFVSSCI